MNASCDTQMILTEQEKALILKIPLFQNASEMLRKTLFDEVEISSQELTKGEVIIQQGTKCRHLNILLKGILEVNIIDALGNNIKVENLFAPRIFATPHLFDELNIYPATFTVVEDGKLVRFSKDSIFKIISKEPEILKNFMKITGNCTCCTVVRLRLLSLKTIRSRFVAYLFEHRQQGSNISYLVHNQTQLADYLGVTRPALATEISRMQKEGLFEIADRQVKLLDLSALRRYV